MVIVKVIAIAIVASEAGIQKGGVYDYEYQAKVSTLTTMMIPIYPLKAPTVHNHS
jgi:hypothetical protein